jgi:hypothetical protein
MAGKIFINYRREDSIGMAGRLHDRLAQTFGRDNLFMDVDHIPVGADFVAHLKSQLAACSVLLVVIGPNWLNAKDESGERRLDNPDDFVAIEIAAALARDIRVIPVLVDGARMPKTKELPDSLKPLVRRQAAEVRHTRFGHDAEALVARMREALGRKAAGPRRWRRWTITRGAAVTVLLLIGWRVVQNIHVTTVERNVQQTREAEQQPLATDKAGQEHQAPAAEAAAKLKAEQAEQQRLGTVRAKQEGHNQPGPEARARTDALNSQGNEASGAGG